LYAFEIEKNNTKAVNYWSIGWNEFKNGDCAYNLGCMWFNGMLPNETQDIVLYKNVFCCFLKTYILKKFKTKKRKAWEFWTYAALNNHQASQIQVAYINHKGYNLTMRSARIASQ